MEKVKFKDLVTGGIIAETLVEVAPRLEGKDPAEVMGLTETQYARLEKKVTEKVLTLAEEAFKGALLEEKGVELKDTALIYVHTSTGYKNEDGSFKKRVAARTREVFNKQLNKK